MQYIEKDIRKERWRERERTEGVRKETEAVEGVNRKEINRKKAEIFRSFKKKDKRQKVYKIFKNIK